MKYILSRLSCGILFFGLFACGQQNKSTATGNDNPSVNDDNYYAIDCRLHPDRRYSMTYSESQQIISDQSSQVKTKMDPVVSTEFYTMTTSKRKDSILLILSHDTTTYVGKRARNKELQRRIGKGSAYKGKKIKMEGPDRYKWPSRKVWENQNDRPKGKMQIGESYTYHQKHYNGQDGHKQVHYQFKNVKDSIAYFEMRPWTFQRGASEVEMSASLEYDLRNNYYSKIIEEEKSKTPVKGDGEAVSIGRHQKRTYTIDSGVPMTK